MRLMVVIDSEGEKAWVNPLEVSYISRCFSLGEEPALYSRVNLKGGDAAIRITRERENATVIEWENAMRGLND